MDVWNEEVTSQKEKIMVTKDLTFKVFVFETQKQKGGLRIPLKDNNELCDKFQEYIDELKASGKLSEREKKFDMIRFSTFADNDKEGLPIYQTIGFYYLQEFTIFADEEDAPTPEKRFQVWVDNYKKLYQINVPPKRDLLDQLGKLEISDDE